MADKRPKRFHCPAHWTLAQRLAHYTDKSGGPDACWPWTGATVQGYGVLRWEGGPRRVSRLVWAEKNGPIPDGLDVLHECDNPPCRNEAHLFLGTPADNHADKVAKGRQPRGVLWRSKLTEEQARAIYHAHGSQTAIAARFGISQTLVSQIKLRKIWQHLHSKT